MGTKTLYKSKVGSPERTLKIGGRGVYRSTKIELKVLKETEDYIITEGNFMHGIVPSPRTAIEFKKDRVYWNKEGGQRPNPTHSTSIDYYVADIQDYNERYYPGLEVIHG
jgi:hypothetical protein